MKKYIVRWRINPHLSFDKIFDASNKKEAIEVAKKHYAKSMPARMDLWKADRLDVTELIEGKENGDNNGIIEEDN